MRRAVFSPFYPVSDKTDISHRSGWARYWANELGAELLTTKTMSQVDDFKRGDELYAYHGMEFKGQMNLQSGLTDEILARAKRLLDAKKRGVKIVSLDIAMPKYGSLLMERGMDPTSGEALDKIADRSKHFDIPNVTPEHVVIGDSHSLSMYTPGTVILREDGQTLFGALHQGLQKKIDIVDFEWTVELGRLERLSFYYGNIDLRHHLCRPEAVSVKDLVDQYGQQIVEIRKNYSPGLIEIVAPLPIENECRQIPKSGWYKGSAFFGSWEERNAMRKELDKRLKAMCKKHGFRYYEHPKHFTNKQGELSFDVMEQPRSVHLRPAEYRLVQEGNQWKV